MSQEWQRAEFSGLDPPSPQLRPFIHSALLVPLSPPNFPLHCFVIRHAGTSIFPPAAAP